MASTLHARMSTPAEIRAKLDAMYRLKAYLPNEDGLFDDDLWLITELRAALDREAELTRLLTPTSGDFTFTSGEKEKIEKLKTQLELTEESLKVYAGYVGCSPIDLEFGGQAHIGPGRARETLKRIEEMKK